MFQRPLAALTLLVLGTGFATAADLSVSVNGSIQLQR